MNDVRWSFVPMDYLIKYNIILYKLYIDFEFHLHNKKFQSKLKDENIAKPCDDGKENFQFFQTTRRGRISHTFISIFDTNMIILQCLLI